jgi:hypothetical protein
MCFGHFDLSRTMAAVKVLRTSAVQRHRSVFPDLCRWRAEAWARKAEVCEGADEGAEGSLVVLLKDLKRSC